MFDWPPKNPHPSDVKDEFDGLSRVARFYWQQGYEDTVKALRPTHKDLLSICRTFTKAFSPTDRALEVIKELEEVLRSG